MGSIDVFDKARMLAIEAASVVSGLVNGSGHLMLTKHDGSTTDAGSVVGPQGPTGPTGVGVLSGQIMMYGSASVPSGYLQCNGAAVSRSTYSALFAAIGTTWGAGDGSTTFNVPNLVNKFPRGSTTGSSGGADAHTHTTALHTHDSGSLHAQLRMATSDALLQANIITVPSYTVTNQLNTTSATTATNARTNGVNVAGTTGNQTGGAPDTGSASNVPAYVGINFIIKT